MRNDMRFLHDPAHLGATIASIYDCVLDHEAAGLELVAPHIRRAIELSNVLGRRRVLAELVARALSMASPLHAGPGWQPRAAAHYITLM